MRRIDHAIVYLSQASLSYRDLLIIAAVDALKGGDIERPKVFQERIINDKEFVIDHITAIFNPEFSDKLLEEMKSLYNDCFGPQPHFFANGEFIVEKREEFVKNVLAIIVRLNHVFKVLVEAGKEDPHYPLWQKIAIALVKTTVYSLMIGMLPVMLVEVEPIFQAIKDNKFAADEKYRLEVLKEQVSLSGSLIVTISDWKDDPLLAEAEHLNRSMLELFSNTDNSFADLVKDVHTFLPQLFSAFMKLDEEGRKALQEYFGSLKLQRK